jgi:hypothetical protein
VNHSIATGYNETVDAALVDRGTPVGKRHVISFGTQVNEVCACCAKCIQGQIAMQPTIAFA